MNTMQEGIDKAIAENIESVLFYMKDGMTKDQAMKLQRKSSHKVDWAELVRTNVAEYEKRQIEDVKMWEQVSKTVDVSVAEQLAQTMIKSEWMVIGKLQEMQVTDLLGGELTRAFAGANEWQRCHKIVRRLSKRGLTFEVLNRL